jgi:hypothetical protein
LITSSGSPPGLQRGLEKAFWDPHGVLALPRPLRDLEGLLSLGLRSPFVKLAAGLDGGHRAGPPRPTQQLLQVLPLHAPIRPIPSPFPCFLQSESNTLQIFTNWVTGWRGWDTVQGTFDGKMLDICSLSDKIS